MPFELTREFIEQLKEVVKSEDNKAAHKMIVDLHPADIAEVFGEISNEEAKFIYEEGADKLIIGSGQTGMVRLSDEATDFFNKKHCIVEINPTSKAVEIWNSENGSVIALLHITC